MVQLEKGPSGANQWSRPGDGPLMMMTTDLALWVDEDYKEIVTEYANDIDSLNANFAAAWKKLTERSTGSRAIIGRFSLCFFIHSRARGAA